jgi:hypothetical protein
MTTIGRLAATGAVLGVLTTLVVGAWWFGRHRRAGGRRDVQAAADVDRGAPDRGAGPDAAIERTEGGWSLDLPDDP